MSDWINSELDESLERGREVLNYLNDRSQRCLLDKNYKWLRAEALEINEVFLFRILEVTFEEKAPRKEAIENILGTLRGMDGVSFIYMILGGADGVNFYFGAALDKSYRKDKMPFSVHDLEQDILTPSMKGNFRGSKLEEVKREDKAKIIESLKKARSFGMLEGVPSVDKDNENFQGTDRLIDVMSGDSFGFVVIATPCTDAETDSLERQIYQLSDAIAPLAHHTVQRSTSINKNRNRSSNTTSTEQSGTSAQTNDSKTDSTNDVTSADERNDTSDQTQTSSSKSATEQWSMNKNYNKNDSDKQSASNGSGESHSVQDHYSTSYNTTATKGKTKSHSESAAHSIGRSTSTTTSKSKAKNTVDAEGWTTGDSTSKSEQLEAESRSALDWTEYINKVLLPRLDHGRGKGIFQCCTYLFADKRTSLYRLANTAISLYSGSTGNKSALFFSDLTERKDDADCLTALQNLQIPSIERDQSSKSFPATGFSRLEKGGASYCGSWFSSNELGLLAGLPQKEVIGLRLREEVEFGLNVEPVPEEFAIKLGHLVQSGEIKKNIPVSLDKRDLDKHAFISGVTGSGKTTTCQNILLAWDQPFLVIEPAKTEYRSLLEKRSDILFFTPGLPDVAPFFLNPFELFPGEKISSRADMLKATFEASFAMEAAIPQIMEAAIYRAYENKGWNVETNEWSGAGDPFSGGVYAFPTLSDFVTAAKEITEKQGFDERLKNDYLGSINARLEGLLVGAKGQMFNTVRSLDFSELIKRRVVIELEEIRSSAEKSLLMGFILTNLLQAVKQTRSRHITLIEEAHRLLSRYVPGDNLNKKQGVEVFADMLAEVRKYGESLIIVDQIPEKMTPEVLKNTNTKIVHKLFAQDDKDAVGNTMALTDEQKKFLSNLPPGRAVMFSQGWTKAIQLQVEEKLSTSRTEIETAQIRSTALKYYLEPQNVKRGILRGLEKLSWVNEEILIKYFELTAVGKTFLKIYREYLKDGSAGEERRLEDRKKFEAFAAHIKRAVKKFGVELVTAYLYWNAYAEADVEREKRLSGIIRNIVDDANAKMSLINNNITALS